MIEVVLAIAFVALGVAAGGFVLYLLVPRRDPKLAELERKSEPSAARFPEPSRSPVGSIDEANREAAALMRQGKKIEAIKVYREATGVGLAEAKAAVERL